MSPTLHVILSMSLTMGVPLVWAVRELVMLRADNGGSLPGGPDALPEPRPLPPELTRKPLPPGLVPPDYALATVTPLPERV
jgi:hypothetical protein